MTSLCVYKYLKNEIVVSVSYKMFHDTPEDIYPSISICFEFEHHKTGPFKDTNDIKKYDISNIMKGMAKFNQSLVGNLIYEDMTIKLEIKKSFYLMLSNIRFTVPCAYSECLKIYGDRMIKCFTYRVTRKKVYPIFVIFYPNYMVKIPKEFDIQKCRFMNTA